MTDIALSKICKSFNGQIVLEDFSHVFSEGSVTCIMGPSGCGKTTLLLIAMGLLKPDSGQISGIYAESRLAAVFQEDRLCENLSAVLNVKLVKCRGSQRKASRSGRGDSTRLGAAAEKDGYNRKLRETADREEAEEILRKTGIDSDAFYKPVRELSGGMRRRVAVARALIAKPDALFLDEPFSGLDEAAKIETAGLIAKRAGNSTIIMVSHNEDDATLLNGEILHLMRTEP